MQLTLNVDDLSNLTIKSSDGTVYKIVEQKPIRQQPAIRKTLVTQQELMKLYKCGYARVQKWVAMGLHEIPDGKYVLYDLNELEELLRQKKI